MKGLRLFLPPFAPDTAGAASVLYPLGGLVVIVDAGGCAGNICGFDEPRFSVPQKTASVFTSAALRDMDAILGRDQHLIHHIKETIADFQSIGHTFPFIALVGTPVPAVIGTDLAALARLLEQDLGIPVIAIDTDGTEAYDVGIGKTYDALFHHVARIPSQIAPRPGTLGVLGATTLDVGSDAAAPLRTLLQNNGWNAIRLYGFDSDLTQYATAAQNEKNLVIAPAGLPAARWLKQTFHTPYEIAYPLAKRLLAQAVDAVPLPKTAKNILILHQQIAARTLRELLQARYPDACIACATYFQQIGAIAKPQDIKLRDESDLPALVQAKSYDVILGDPLYQRVLADDIGTFLPIPHPAVSGFPE